MLPSWRDEVRIALCPDRVILARVSGHWRGHVTAKHIVRVAALHATDWRACMEALRETLADERWGNAQATVIVSSHFVQYALVPWSEELVAADEKRAWVQHHFAEAYGESVANAEYRWSEDGPAAPCITSAVNGEFVNQLRRTFEATSLELKSIQPYFMAVFNRWRRRTNRSAVWMLVVEPGRVSLGSMAQGKWRRIVSRRIGADLRSELRIVLSREQVLCDAADAPVSVLAYVPEVPKFEIPGWNEVPLHSLAPRALAGFSPHSDSDYAMALTGVA